MEVFAACLDTKELVLQVMIIHEKRFFDASDAHHAAPPAQKRRVQFTTCF
jgi:hypothetical protein